MPSEFDSLLANTPKTVAFSDFHNRGDIDLRRSCVDVLLVNTIGINADCADGLPDDDPPNTHERLAWIWFIRPDLVPEVLPHATGNFAELVICYAENRIDDWWSRMSTA